MSSQQVKEQAFTSLVFFIFSAVIFTVMVVNSKIKKEKINPEIWFYLVGSYIMIILCFLALMYG
jgi:uncharacterized membrane protein